MKRLLILLFLFCPVIALLGQEGGTFDDYLKEMAKTDTIYKVQFKSSKKIIDHFYDIEKKYGKEFITYYEHNGLYRYTFGEYASDPKPAIELKKEFVKLGYSDAFVVAFKNGKRLFDVIIYKKYDF